MVPERDGHSYGVVMNVAGPMNIHPVNVNTRPAMIKTRGAFCKHVKREGRKRLMVDY